MASSPDTTLSSDLKECDIKIILLGDSAVGKSKLVERFLMDSYKPRQLSTYALTVFRYDTVVDNKEISIDFWDTAGQERFASMHPSYYYRAHVCILVFDVTRKLTYTHLTDWYKELRQYSASVPVIVVANKIDINYEVTTKPFQFATKRNLPFMFCSAADGTNVVKTFRDAIEAAILYKNNPGEDFMDQLLETVDYLEKKEQEKDTFVPLVKEPTNIDPSQSYDLDKEYM